MGGFSTAGGVEMKEKMLELERKSGQRIEHTLAAVSATGLCNLIALNPPQTQTDSHFPHPH
jgi:hypothetical protein